MMLERAEHNIIIIIRATGILISLLLALLLRAKPRGLIMMG